MQDFFHPPYVEGDHSNMGPRLRIWIMPKSFDHFLSDASSWYGPIHPNSPDGSQCRWPCLSLCIFIICCCFDRCWLVKTAVLLVQCTIESHFLLVKSPFCLFQPTLLQKLGWLNRPISEFGFTVFAADLPTLGRSIHIPRSRNHSNSQHLHGFFESKAVYWRSSLAA